MTQTTTILFGHPDTDPARLCHSLMIHYARAAEQAGQKVNLIEIGKLDFSSVLSTVDHANGEIPADIKEAQQKISESDKLVLIFPLWLGSLPGRFKMFLEQVFRPGFAYDYDEKGWPQGHLKGKSADVIVTMGMPALMYKTYFRAHGIKNLKRNILNFVGIKDVHIEYIGMAESLKTEDAEKLFLEIEALATR